MHSWGSISNKSRWSLHKVQFLVIRLVTMSSSPNDYLCQVPTHHTVLQPITHHRKRNKEGTLMQSFCTVLKNCWNYSQSSGVWCVTFHVVFRIQEKNLYEWWRQLITGLADEYNAYLGNMVQTAAWLMYTRYDVEANTNWFVFLPSVAINTMSERYSIGGCITTWWTPK
jgi:hypothetical protein